MENKYYTPDISELYVGFECEHTSNMSAFEFDEDLKIEKGALKQVDLINYLSWSFDDPLEKFVRVKYLNSEDIESLGFILEGGTLIRNRKYVFRNKEETIGMTLRLNYYDDQFPDVHIYEIRKSFVTIFLGKVKNKSELIKIMKQLSINGN